MARMSDTPIDERLAWLAEQKFEDDQISKPKIQKVPTILRKNPNFATYYIPKAISFGPIHYRNDDLRLGQQLKIRWTFLYIGEYSTQTYKSTSEAAQFLHRIVKDNMGELKNLFNEDVTESYKDDEEELTWMLFVDGCSLLYYMEHFDYLRPETLKLKVDQLLYTWRDITLLENQLPMRLLGLLSKMEGADLEYLVSNFISMGATKRAGETALYSPQIATSTHILDYWRSLDLMENENNVENHDEHDQMTPLPLEEEMFVGHTFKNIRDLKKAGIRVRLSKVFGLISNSISFTSRWFSGELRLPLFLGNSITPYSILNMIAYEMCPDFHNNFAYCSRFSFFDSLIDDAEDVKELRSAGVLQNLLMSDEEVAKVINEIGNDLPTKMFHYIKSDSVAYSRKYVDIKKQIDHHCRNKWKTWLAELLNTYFNTPWSLIAFLAALLALIFTFIQTWGAIHPKEN